MRGGSGSTADRGSSAGPPVTRESGVVDEHHRWIPAEPWLTDDTDYGSHDFAARDPEGNRWSFGTYRGEPRKTR